MTVPRPDDGEGCVNIGERLLDEDCRRCNYKMKRVGDVNSINSRGRRLDRGLCC
jgi:hypothetical protein